MSNKKRSKKINKKRSIKKNKIKKGGKFLGRGRHGCVYGKWNEENALFKISQTCSTNNDKNKGVKILDNHENLLEEWESTSVIRELIEDYKKWYYIPQKKCRIERMLKEDIYENNSSPSNESKCHFKINKNSALVLPIADYSGNQKIPEKLETLLVAFKNLFEGISILNENNIVHNDLKEPNVVYTIKDKKFYIIDFGHMRTFQQEGWRLASLKDILYYHAWPFDWFFGTFLLKKIKNNNSRNVRYNYTIKELIDNIDNISFDYLWELFEKRFYKGKEGSPVMRGLKITDSKLNNWCEIISKNDLQLSLSEYISLSTKKLDLWAISKCCSAIVEKNYPNVNNELVRKFNILMESFLNPSVFKRPTAKVALDMYNKYLSENNLI